MTISPQRKGRVYRKSAIYRPELDSIQFCDLCLHWRYIRRVHLSSICPLVTVWFQTPGDRTLNRRRLHQWEYDTREEAQSAYDAITSRVDCNDPQYRADNLTIDPNWQPDRWDKTIIVNDNIVVVDDDEAA